MNRAFAHIAAILFVAFAVLPATAAAQDATAGLGGGSAFVRQVVSTPDGAFAGRSSRVLGNVAAGVTSVTVDVRGADGLWIRIGSAPVNADGSFEISWTPAKAGRYDVRLTPAGAARIAGDEPDGSLSVYRLQKATWYGPGFFGRRTACGVKLTRRTLGVAHRSLPCGTKVALFAGGRRVTVRVIDRGPFARGVRWDLTYATAKALDSLVTTNLGALPVG
ncbi:MAG: hypothetical protein JJE27_01330 [Thermoleophilia bacterium]|nr:hypothetical protein [Thermoleophilia bacterium]